MKKLLVFTDLDGSLLNHDDYSYQDAIPALEALCTRGYPLIIVSSKTQAEIIPLREQLNNHHPFICENGATTVFNEDYFFSKDVSCSGATSLNILGTPYKDIVAILYSARETHGFNFIGFHDMDIATIMRLTGLNEKNALAASRRQASEPIIWNDSSTALKQLKALLAENRLQIVKGGRFYHVMSPLTKGTAIGELLDRFRVKEPKTLWVTLALGDSYNDVAMLEMVDYPVLIFNPHINPPDVSHIKNIFTTSLPGAAGWNEAVLGTMEKIDRGNNHG